MIRVIYRWRVTPENSPQFRAEWTKTTNKIHETVQGALGSFMLQDAQHPDIILTIAKWDSMASWQAFWDKESPPEMAKMHKLGECLSANAYNEIDDFTRYTQCAAINTHKSVLCVVDAGDLKSHILWTYDDSTNTVHHLSHFGDSRNSVGVGKLDKNGNFTSKIRFQGEPEDSYRIYTQTTSRYCFRAITAVSVQGA